MNKKRISARGRGSFLSTAKAAEEIKEERKEEKTNSSLVKMNLLVRLDRPQQLKIYAAKNRLKLHEALEQALGLLLDEK